MQRRARNYKKLTEEKASNKVLQIKEIQMQKLRNAHAIISAGTKDATENSDLYWLHKTKDFPFSYIILTSFTFVKNWFHVHIQIREVF